MTKIHIDILRIGDESYFKREQLWHLLEGIAGDYPGLTVVDLLRVFARAGLYGEKECKCVHSSKCIEDKLTRAYFIRGECAIIGECKKFEED
jgi:hypothetical protein